MIQNRNELLSKIVILQDEDLFLNLEESWYVGNEYYAFLHKHFDAYRKLPTFGAVKKKLLEPLEAEYFSDSVEYFLVEAKREYLIQEIEATLKANLKTLKNDPETFLNNLGSLSSTHLQVNESNVLHYGDDASQRKHEYFELAKNEGRTYLKWDDAILDPITKGIESTDLVTIAGKPGTGKTWLLLKLTSLLDAFIQRVKSGLITYPIKLDFNRPILFISNEMNNKQLKVRADSVNLGITYKGLSDADLSIVEKKQYFKGLDNLKSNLILVYDVKTIKKIEALIHRYNPLAIFIDGAYLLEPQIPNQFDRVTHITRSLKALALNRHVPIYQTIQFVKKGGVKKDQFFVDAGDDLPYGTYTQDSDIVATMVADKSLFLLHLLTCNIIKHRNNSLNSFYFERNVPAGIFNFLTEDDVSSTFEDEDLL
jgi:energy-coupling factor transporter ATP-binding protein EcfA2